MSKIFIAESFFDQIFYFLKIRAIFKDDAGDFFCHECANNRE